MVGCLKSNIFVTKDYDSVRKFIAFFLKTKNFFFQKVKSVVGGRYTQHKKKEVGFTISNQIHSTLTGSKSMRRRAWIELDKLIAIPPHTNFYPYELSD